MEWRLKVKVLVLAQEVLDFKIKVSSARGAGALGILRVWRKCRVRNNFIYMSIGPRYFYCKYSMSNSLIAAEGKEYV